MKDSVLVAERRDNKGKADARRLRRAGKVPAIIYGEVDEPTSFTVDAHELDVFLRQGHSLISIKLDGKEQQAIIREIQRHPVQSNILHVDFLGLKKGHKITLSVPINFEGKAKGLNEGGLFFSLKNDVSIEVLPKDVPDEIIINIDDLGLNESLRVKDLEKENVAFLDDPEDIICRVEIPKIVEEPTEDEEAELEGEEEESAEPEVITAKDKEESEE
jgi:large subunit ribosomal protein L25